MAGDKCAKINDIIMRCKKINIFMYNLCKYIKILIIILIYKI